MRVLDLFCGAGGAAMGLHRAWPEAEIVGVDIKPQPRYPFTFFPFDVAEMRFRKGFVGIPLLGEWEFDFIWASPPCQGYSWTNHIHHCQQRPYPRLIEETRKNLKATGIPYVIENVVGAPLETPLMLCGTQFGLPLRRHRVFESSQALLTPGNCRHNGDFGVYAGKVTRLGTHGTAYTAGSGRTHYRPKTGTMDDGKRAMGIDWMNMAELSQAIPPAYSQYIAERFNVARD